MGRGFGDTTEEEEDDSQNNITYEIVGIYKTSNPTDLDSASFMNAFSLVENTMYAPYTTVLNSELVGLEGDELAEAKVQKEEEGYQIQNVTFILNDPEDVDLFIEEVENMDGINTKYRTLNANDNEYQAMVGPIESVSKTSMILVIVVVIAALFIIGLLSMLTIKDRKYELGVLLSLGEGKAKIVMQLITEMLIIAIISFSLASVLSIYTAQGTTNYLLNQEIENQEEENNSGNIEMPNDRRGGMMMGMGGPSSEQLSNLDTEVIDELTVSINKMDIIKTFGVGILIIIIANILQALFVLKCNPKEIMLDR